jgi:hypothetical protein
LLSGYQAPIVTILSVNPTLVTFSIAMHEFSLPAGHYTVALNRVTGDNQRLCEANVDQRQLQILANELADMITISHLEELSTYDLTVMSNFNSFNERVTRRAALNFTTPGAGKIASCPYLITLY